MSSTPRSVWDAMDAAKQAARDTVRQIRDDSIRTGIAEAHAGNVRPAREIFAELGIAADVDDERRRNAWSWRSTGDPGRFELWHHGEPVAMLSVLPGHISQRAVLLDVVVDHLNNT